MSSDGSHIALIKAYTVYEYFPRCVQPIDTVLWFNDYNDVGVVRVARIRFKQTMTLTSIAIGSACDTRRTCD